MKRLIGWGLTVVLAIVCFVTFLLWFFDDNVTAKFIFLVSFGLEIYGIFTMDNSKKT